MEDDCMQEFFITNTKNKERVQLLHYRFKVFPITKPVFITYGKVWNRVSRKIKSVSDPIWRGVSALTTGASATKICQSSGGQPPNTPPHPQLNNAVLKNNNNDLEATSANSIKPVVKKAVRRKPQVKKQLALSANLIHDTSANQQNLAISATTSGNSDQADLGHTSEEPGDDQLVRRLSADIKSSAPKEYPDVEQGKTKVSYPYSVITIQG